MKKAIIYGGAFNPPTVAHQAILQACLVYAKEVDAEIWLLPSGNRSDKEIATDNNFRLDIIAALINSTESLGINIQLKTEELFNSKLTQTIETYTLFANNFPMYKQVWVFGSDSIQTMPYWESGVWMYNNLEMLVIDRPGYKLEEFPPKAEVIAVDTPNISSTMVRARLAAGNSIKDLVPETVLQILNHH